MRLRPLFALSLLLFAAGVLIGTAVDDLPERPLERRGPYYVLEADFHIHTRFSDGFLSPLDVVVQAQRRGLHALSVSEHNIVFPSLVARWFSRLIGGPIVIPGSEITTRRFHIHGIGLSGAVDWEQPLGDIIDDIHEQGGVAIAAHPILRFWPELTPVRAELDGAEVMHPIAYRTGSGPGWRWSEMRDFYQDARDAGIELAAIGSSDYHFFSPLGICRTLVFADRPDADAILDALREARTVVYDLDGRGYGDPDMLALLEVQPYDFAEQDYNYAGNGWLDRIARTTGWLGLLGLILFRRDRHVDCMAGGRAMETLERLG